VEETMKNNMKKYGAIFGSAWLGLALFGITGYSFDNWQYYAIVVPTLIGFWIHDDYLENNLNKNNK